jgi:hypothetical protein
MKTLKWLSVTCGLALVLALAAAPAARAQSYDNWYASVNIDNPTAYTLTYRFRWGENGVETAWTLPPYTNRTHWYPYAYANQNSSPNPYIRFDIGGGAATREYRLIANAAPNTDSYWSNHYFFQYTGLYLDLYHR